MFGVYKSKKLPCSTHRKCALMSYILHLHIQYPNRAVEMVFQTLQRPISCGDHFHNSFGCSNYGLEEGIEKIPTIILIGKYKKKQLSGSLWWGNQRVVRFCWGLCYTSFRRSFMARRAWGVSTSSSSAAETSTSSRSSSWRRMTLLPPRSSVRASSSGK